MSLRKLVGLLAGFALAVGLIGAGVSASFTSSVSAVQDINVGTFGCGITSTTGGAVPGGYLNGYYHTVTYTAPDIAISTAGSSAFDFTVTSFGSIPAKLHLTQTAPAAPFTSLLADPVNDVVLNQNGTHTYNAGLSWPELTNLNLGQHVSISYSVTCGEVGLVIFDNTPSTLPGNLASVAFQATSTSEWGTEVTFAGSARKLTTATVTMSSWACETSSGATCVTTPGATFNVPIRFNVYNVGLGAPIASVTQTFAIPYRPSADAVNCADHTQWFDGTKCNNGKAANITFTFSGQTLPNTAIFGIAYNTYTHGYSPVGSGGPVDSLNVACYPGVGAQSGVTGTVPSVGTFVDPVGTFLNSSVAGFYLNNSAPGTFRLDTGVDVGGSAIGPWGGYEPAVQITAS